MKASRLFEMSYAERTERLRSLAESLSADEAERDRLKQRTDESLTRLHHAVREFMEIHELKGSVPSSGPLRV
jgi:hypothetical protein